MTISSDIARYVSSMRYEDLPMEVIHEVKRRILDGLGCAIGAVNSRPGRIAREIARGVRCDSGATIPGTGHRTSPELSTFAGGVLFRYLDFNDTYLAKEPAHPSDNIPAAIAVAESAGADGTALILSIVLGYEIQCRLCDAASLRSKGWDHVGYVSMSSAMLASRLMGMGRDETGHALALSITPNVTLRQTRIGELSMWKGCAAANAARNGVFAAMIARGGMTGPSWIFEGERGFFNQVTGPFTLDVDDFGGRRGGFRITDTYIKHYPSEYHSQAGVEAALRLRGRIRIEDIASIDIETYDACVDIIAGEKEKWNPRTRETADHSLPYIVAVALSDGRVGLEQFSVQRINDPGLQDLTGKVTVKRNDEHSRRYPESFPCRIDIACKSGSVYTETVDYPKGHPKNPLTDKEVEGKFKELNSGLLTDGAVRDIFDAVWNLEDIKRGVFLILRIKFAKTNSD